MIAGKAPHANYVFVAPNAGRRLLRLGLLASWWGCASAARWRSPSAAWEQFWLAGVSAAFLLVIWAVLQAKIPQRITIRGAVIEIRRDGHVDSFDLEDPGVEIRVMDGEIAFSSYMERWVVVRARDVDWKVFTDVVMHYQDKADRHAEERDRRFSS